MCFLFGLESFISTGSLQKVWFEMLDCFHLIKVRVGFLGWRGSGFFASKLLVDEIYSTVGTQERSVSIKMLFQIGCSSRQ
jgi:hypothetical protein